MKDGSRESLPSVSPVFLSRAKALNLFLCDSPLQNAYIRCLSPAYVPRNRVICVGSTWCVVEALRARQVLTSSLCCLLCGLFSLLCRVGTCFSTHSSTSFRVRRLVHTGGGFGTSNGSVWQSRTQSVVKKHRMSTRSVRCPVNRCGTADWRLAFVSNSPPSLHVALALLLFDILRPLCTFRRKRTNDVCFCLATRKWCRCTRQEATAVRRLARATRFRPMSLFSAIRRAARSASPSKRNSLASVLLCWTSPW